MPKRDYIPVSVFYIVFHDISVAYPLFLFLLLVLSAYLEGVFADSEISLVGREYIIVYFHLGQEKYVLSEGEK